MELWPEALKQISEKISKPSYVTWFANTDIEVETDTITVCAPNSFAEDWLARNYDDLISETVKEITGKVYTIQYMNAKDGKEFTYERPSNRTYPDQDSIMNQLQKRIEQLEDRVRQLEERG